MYSRFLTSGIICGLTLVVLLSNDVGASRLSQRTIKGTVCDQRGAPLDKVDVFVIDPAGNDKYATSDANGEYEVEIPSADEVKVAVFDTKDAKAKRMTFAVNVNGKVSHDVSWILKPMSAQDKETQEFFRTTLRQLRETAKSKELKARIVDFVEIAF